MTFTAINHYVPQWYQKRFLLPGLKEQKFYYLDLTPERIMHPNGGSHVRHEIRRLGAANCFAQEHLYTLFFGNISADVIEKRFFGKIDDWGADAVNFISSYEINDKTGNAINNLVRYLDAQKLRTPKGLDYLRKLSGVNTHEAVLTVMQRLWQLHVTIWMEGVWEIVQCDTSPTKLIVTDHPVTTYNKKLFPASKDCLYPLDAPVELLGSHTIFPLDLNRCLIITNLGYVRNSTANPLKVRENPRYFAQTLFDIRKVQTGHSVTEDYVRAINYVLKTRAKRYIAAASKEWLFPERFLQSTMWNKLGGKFFLMPDPRKVAFHTETLIGYKDGSAWGIDEYGRRPRDDDPHVKKLRNAEWETFQKAKQEWDTCFGELDTEEWKRYF